MIGKTIPPRRDKILSKLGEGGMGVKAEDIKLNRTVALKFLPTNKLDT